MNPAELLEAITGGVAPEVYIAQRTAEIQAALAEIRALIRAP